MNFDTILRHVSEHIRNEGVGGTARWMFRRAQWRLHERRYGINTESVIPMAELGIDNEVAGEYAPTDYTDFAKIMRALALTPQQHVFVDFGAGLGRVVVLAATQPFRRVIGIEHSAELVRSANANIKNARLKLKCAHVEVVHSDATVYRLPEDASVLYFNNSFFGAVLETVLGNIRGLGQRGAARGRGLQPAFPFAVRRADQKTWLARPEERARAQ
jgi:hypothetical protein